MQVTVRPVCQSRVVKPRGSQPACSETGLPKAWGKMELWEQTVYPELRGDSGTPQGWSQHGFECPRCLPNLLPKPPASPSPPHVQSTKHPGFFLVCLYFQGSPSDTAGYPVLFQTKQTLLQPLMTFCSFYQSCCCIPDSFHASIFPGRNDLAYKAAVRRCFPFPAGSCTTFWDHFPSGCCFSSYFVPVL